VSAIVGKPFQVTAPNVLKNKVFHVPQSSSPHRTILPDPKFGNDMLAKFINMVMERGKKSAAEKSSTVPSIASATRAAAPARGNCCVAAGAGQRQARGRGQVPSRRRRHLSGAVEVRANRRQTLAMRWVIEAATARSEKSMAHRLAA